MATEQEIREQLVLALECCVEALQAVDMDTGLSEHGSMTIVHALCAIQDAEEFEEEQASCAS